MRLRGGVDGLLHGIQLLLQRTLAGGVVCHFLQRPVERAAVLGHGLVIAGTRRTQLGAQATAVEDRQADGRANAGNAGAALGQHIKPQRLHPNKGAQIHIRIELGLFGGHTRLQRLRLQTRCHHVGPATQQVGGNLIGQRPLLAPRCLQSFCIDLDAASTIRACAHQGCNAVALQGYLLLHLRQLGPRCGQPRIGTVHTALVFQAIGIALGKQVCRGLAHFQRLLQRLLIGRQSQQLRIGHGHIAGQQQTRLRGVGLTRRQLSCGSGHRGSLLAPEVQRPAHVQRCATIVIHAAWRESLRGQVVVAELVLRS